MPDEPTAVYRAFAANGDLLYIGMSSHLADRLKTHSTASPWWRHADAFSVEYFGTREEAAGAESRAIGAEGPLWNCHYNWRGEAERHAVMAASYPPAPYNESPTPGSLAALFDEWIVARGEQPAPNPATAVAS